MARRLMLGLAPVAALCLFVVMPAAAADLTLKRVMLSTGGVGYFEYEAPVEGDATLALDVPLDQVDDVLKSLVVYDAAGSAGEITLPGRQPLAQGFADLPFDRAALASEIDLLNALQGAEIRIAAPKALSGRLLHVERETVAGPGGAAATRTLVSIMTDAGLQQFALQDVDAIAFADAKLQRQVAAALQRIAAYRTAGQRELTLHLRGAGARTVRVGYVVAMPLWKATYRLSLPADAQAKTARLQGWAVLENFSGRAWRNVKLTLLSGNPVTFRQALYESYYVPRPLVPVEAGSRVLPPPDSGTVAAETAAKAMPLPQRSFDLRDRLGSNMAQLAPGAPLPPAAAPPPAPLNAATAEEEATQVAFTPPYPVDVAAGQSLVLPLIDRELPARRLDLYQPSVDARHPLAAIELTNNSGSGLPPGVLTLYQEEEQSGALYVGDARLAALPAGDKRLLSYAVDSKTVIDRTSDDHRPVVKATIADGVMRLHRMIRWTTTYRVKAATVPLSLLIEQPRRIGATLAPPNAFIELTPGAYRIPFAVPFDGKGTLAVVEEQPIEETIRLVDLDDSRLGVLVSSTELDAKMRQALAALAARRKAVGRQRAELDHLKQQRAQLVDDETRLRNNLAVLGADPALKKRELDKFADTETKIDAASASLAKASDALTAAEHDLSGYINGLTI